MTLIDVTSWRRPADGQHMRKALVVVCGLTAIGCLHGREPREAEHQLIAFSGHLTGETTKSQVLVLLKGYPLLRAVPGSNESRLTVMTPHRFGAKDWLALLEFSPDERLVRVAFGMSDYAPLRPRYPEAVPELMPADHCFASAAECSRPWN
jgi:hypothetical protein